LALSSIEPDDGNARGVRQRAGIDTDAATRGDVVHRQGDDDLGRGLSELSDQVQTVCKARSGDGHDDEIRAVVGRHIDQQRAGQLLVG
jgi:hypothetical protein